MLPHVKRQRSPVAIVAGVVLLVLLVVAILLVQYGQVWLTGSSPQPLVWIVGTIAILLLAARAVGRRPR
jgi:uncharacterized membrane protein (DUF485 family)